jgi:hypothetical protein
MVIAIGFFGPPNNKSVHTQSNLKAYINPVYGMEILYPAQWQEFQMKGRYDRGLCFLSTG